MTKAVKKAAEAVKEKTKEKTEPKQLFKMKRFQEVAPRTDTHVLVKKSKSPDKKPEVTDKKLESPKVEEVKKNATAVAQ